MPNTLRSAFAIVISLAVIAACNNQGEKQKSAGDSAKQAVTTIDSPAKKSADQPVDSTANNANTEPTSLVIKVLPETDGMPHHVVLLAANGKRTVIDTVNNCEPILEKDYAQYNIPKDATTACGGWFAGAGDYFYLVMRNGKPVVYQGWQAEEQTDKGYHWKEHKF